MTRITFRDDDKATAAERYRIALDVWTDRGFYDPRIGSKYLPVTNNGRA